ncbi:Heavy metal transport/detoxification superfamily protein [Thalictrum thalictroides]|uniref:Heavy metal transport/detoxification superfamily protein n=1 Tax=Thalictrum thalictroides TaxID=46969 RepID=A0A7J6WPF8_THATH|nr:Heavy metal transport/detoxification superfamily protein [Thalictrum thalictroides]
MANLQIVAAYNKNKKVEAQYVEMMVPMYSHGCERKVKKALSNLKGIYSVSVDYKLQKVTVWGICNKLDVLSTIRSKRKEACFWNSDDNCDAQPCAQPMKPALLLRSLSWKAVKKAFIRSTTFRERLSLSVAY